jgi:hypothetical protein
MIPTIQPELDIVNSIREFRDVKYIAQLWKRSYKSIHKYLADLWLTKNFAIDPLISDLIGVYYSLVSIKEQLAELMKVHNKTVTLHYAEHVPDTDEIDYVVSDQYYSRGLLYDHQENKLHASMRCKLIYPALNSGYEGVLALLDALGIQLNPGIVWNAIPFTFLIDWVFKVGDYLEQFKQSNLDVTVIVDDFCISQKIHRALRLECNYWDNPSQTLAFGKVSAYRRYRTIPNIGSSSIGAELPNLKELSLGAALFTANRH